MRPAPAAALVVVAFLTLGVQIAAAGQPAAAPDSLVGTYRLISSEVRQGGSGEWVARDGFNTIGYIIYADTGHMAVQAMPRGRTLFANGQPTPVEAQAALRGYAAYFGTYTVDPAAGVVVHHRVGQINPGGAVDATRFFEFDGDRLILTPAPAEGGKAAATTRIVWERLPAAPLSAEARRFVGFYRLLYTDSYRERDGRLVFHGDENRARSETSYIIYTPTGHMMVHMMLREGRTPYAGAQPTPEEALAAYRSYIGYFGRFTTYENHDPPFVMHNQQGMLRPGGHVDATTRFYMFDGDVLRLGGPPRLNDAGEVTGGHLYWQRLAPVAPR